MSSPSWGSCVAQILRDTLKLGCSREHEARRTANMLQSTQACEAAEVECEAVLEREQSGTLPSTGRADMLHMQQERPLDGHVCSMSRECDQEPSHMLQHRECAVQGRSRCTLQRI